MKKVYPEWKKILWRMARTFFAAFFGTAGTVLAMTDPLRYDLEHIVNTVIVSATVAALSAVFSGLGKYFREEYGDEKYKSKIHRLPF